MMTKDIATILKECGVPVHVKGYEYIGEAIELVLKDHEQIHQITKVLYPNVAKKFNTTPVRVERAIRHAIEMCFNNLDPDTMYAIFGNSISYNRGKATNAQFIATIAELIEQKRDSGVKETK